MAYTFSMSFCPHCNKPINWNFKAGKREIRLKLGEPEIYICKNCNNPISNGKKEWVEMTQDEKTSDKLKITWSCFSGGIFWGFGIGFIIPLLLGANIMISVIVGVIGFSLLSAFFIYGYKCLVDESIERTNKNNIQSEENIKKEEIKKNEEENMNLKFRHILENNGLGKYITLFEKNNLIDINIISELNENDYEKLGIELMGDRKILLKIFKK